VAGSPRWTRLDRGSALAVRDGRIAAIGTDHAVRPHVGAARSHRCTGGVHVRIGVREPSGRHRLARVGKLADLAILDRDLFDRAEGAIGEARVVGTFVEGGAVYETADLGG
jgi:predicted amidohydrolase YtcJ